MKNKLKKCPFCGGKAQHIADGGDHWIECKDCKTTSKCYHPEADAIDAWNQRADHISQSVKKVETTFTREEIEALLVTLRTFAKDYDRKYSPMGRAIIAKCEAALKGGE